MREAFERILLFWYFRGPSLIVKAEGTLEGIRNFPNWIFWTQGQGLLVHHP